MLVPTVDGKPFCVCACVISKCTENGTDGVSDRRDTDASKSPDCASFLPLCQVTVHNVPQCQKLSCSEHH